jgi:histone deacetylase 1/2
MTTATKHQSHKPVVYFYDEEMTNYNYGGGNPMRPHRVRLTTNLVEGYDLTSHMRLMRPSSRSREDIMKFHADDYVDFLMSVTPENQEEYMLQMRRFNLGAVGEADCPVFDGMFEYFQIYTGGSIGGAGLINDGTSDIVMNWSGGMHHAKKGEASGFCYINDIVLAILELLKEHQRVLYVDIDIHHGDGVEEAFYTTDRVMTVSFHKYGDFFPGTGAVGDIGHGRGKQYAVNVPLDNGMDDESYKFVFEPIMEEVMRRYRPEAIVICGGADSLSGDKLGCFNLSLEGHSHCIEFLRKFNVPMLVLGGGGYTMRNVARCWCYETGRLLGKELEDELPESSYEEYDYFMDTHKLRIEISNMKNANTRQQLEELKTSVLEQLKDLPPAPSAHMVAKPPKQEVEGELPEEDMDVRGGGQAHEDRRVVKEEDGYASGGDEDGNEAARRGAAVNVEPAMPANGGGGAQGMDVE